MSPEHKWVQHQKDYVKKQIQENPDVFFIARGNIPEYQFPNVAHFKTIPLAELLARDEISLMICQGGMNTVQEAITFKKKIIIVPVLINSDQPSNCYSYHYKGIAYCHLIDPNLDVGKIIREEKNPNIEQFNKIMMEYN